jgi:hypothetical protein
MALNIQPNGAFSLSDEPLDFGIPKTAPAPAKTQPPPKTSSETQHLRPEQFGKHRAPAGRHSAPSMPTRGTRGKAYSGKHGSDNLSGDINSVVGGNKKKTYTGKHQQRTIPHAVGRQSMGGGLGGSAPLPPANSSRSMGGTDNTKTNSLAHKPNQTKQFVDMHKKMKSFRPSKHEGKNRERLKNLAALDVHRKLP